MRKCAISQQKYFELALDYENAMLWEPLANLEWIVVRETTSLNPSPNTTEYNGSLAHSYGATDVW